MEEINGKIIKDITGLEPDSENVKIIFTDGSYLVQSHEQECCENVCVSQVDGDVCRHIGAVVDALIVKIETGELDFGDTYTATFYTLKTSKYHTFPTKTL